MTSAPRRARVLPAVARDARHVRKLVETLFGAAAALFFIHCGFAGGRRTPRTRHALPLARSAHRILFAKMSAAMSTAAVSARAVVNGGARNAVRGKQISAATPKRRIARPVARRAARAAAATEEAPASET